MTGTAGRVEVRSFRTCFELERRLHRIDRWRIPVPWGVPMRGIGYAAVVLVALLLVGRLPVLGGMVGALPAPVRLVLLPVGVAVALVRLRVDGRPAHWALLAVARQRLSSRELRGYRRSTPVGATAFYGDLPIAADCADGRLRRARVTGPARVELRCGARLRRRGRRVRITHVHDSREAEPRMVELGDGEVLEVRP